jgi:hypothetical protein
MRRLFHSPRGAGNARKGKIPAFRTDRDERGFWARHIEEFARDLVDLDVEIRPPRTEQIALRLHKEDLQTRRSLAAERGVGTHNFDENRPRGLDHTVGGRGARAYDAGKTGGQPDPKISL